MHSEVGLLEHLVGVRASFARNIADHKVSGGTPRGEYGADRTRTDFLGWRLGRAAAGQHPQTGRRGGQRLA